MNDIILASRWWLVLFLIGLASWPIVASLFNKWTNKGYLFSKISGLLILAYGMWILGLSRLAVFSYQSLLVIAVVMAAISWMKFGRKMNVVWGYVLLDELIFVFIFGLWAWIKGHAPEINGLEKFMDFGFTQSILNSSYFPPKDMWFSGFSINYYYFGHLILACITKLSGVDLIFGFNLILATICALTFSMAYAIGREFISIQKRTLSIAGSLFIAILVTFSGNLQTIYAFTKGYQTDNPPPFWEIMSNLNNFSAVKDGWQSYWYPNATRFIPYTIHEFPSYSFVVSDIHGHVLAIPIALLMIAIITLLWKQNNPKFARPLAVVYGFIAGVAMMTNVLDGPIYIGLWIAVWIAISLREKQKLINNLWPIFLAIGVFLLTISPFLSSFKPFVSGVGFNCPPKFLQGKTFGPLIFEGAEKCQKSPIWMLLILWGFFVYWAGVMYHNIPDKEVYKSLAVCFSVFCLALIIFPEFFYFKDIYPLHFRSNTMFKLGYQVFIIMSIISGWTIVYLINNRKSSKKSVVLLVLGIPLILLVLVYPYFSVKSYFDSLRRYKGLNGIKWMQEEYPENWQAVQWINSKKTFLQGKVILEAQGDSYFDSVTRKPYNQISTFTGVPTLAGWYVHEWLWRGQEMIAKRSEIVRRIYETSDASYARELLKEFNVNYVLIGEMEREKYSLLNEQKFDSISRLVFKAGNTRLYQVN